MVGDGFANKRLSFGIRRAINGLQINWEDARRKFLYYWSSYAWDRRRLWVYNHMLLATIDMGLVGG